MSSYHSSFKYLGKKSDEDFGWIIAHFDPDNGETDSYLSQEQIYSESYNGTKRTLYGTKYTSVANIKITVIKQSGGDFTLQECRDAYKWLTGNPEASWMDLYIGDEVKYRLLCTIQDAKPQKLDARTVGLNIYCESLSPWAYSPQITESYSVSGSTSVQINNESDDLYTPVYMKTVYKNTNGQSLVLNNTTIGEQTEISSLATNEVVTLDSNMMITSDNKNKMFGNSFNFVWPRLKAGTNNFSITGNGNITFEYYYPIKMGDCATDINVTRDPICSDDGTIQVDMLPWDRISNKPNTLSGYGLTADIASKYYSKAEVDDMIGSIESTGNVDLSWNSIRNKPTTISGYDITDAYTKSEIDNMFDSLDIPEDVAASWDNIKNKPTTIAGYGITDVYTKSDIYTKKEVDDRLKNLSSSGDGVNVDILSWYKVVDTPNSISGYGIEDAYTKEEINQMLSDTGSVDVPIDEEEFDEMLATILI